MIKFDYDLFWKDLRSKGSLTEVQEATKLTESGIRKMNKNKSYHLENFLILVDYMKENPSKYFIIENDEIPGMVTEDKIEYERKIITTRFMDQMSISNEYFSDLKEEIKRLKAENEELKQRS